MFYSKILSFKTHTSSYFYHNISNTPFTLGIALPNKYGKFRVRGGMEVNQKRIDGE